MKKLLLGVAIGAVAIVVLGALVMGAGLYNVAADEEHSALVYRLIEATRERSIAIRASDVEVPNLDDRESVRRGAGNYDSMCAGCHLSPGAKETEISRGLYPRPPNLAKAETSDPARAFWIIKHGIKATGIPAWGRSMEDSYIWDMVAFIRKLPSMDAEQYAAEVAASEGHSHGGGESESESEGHDGNQRESSSGEEHSHDAADRSESAGQEHSQDGPLAGAAHGHENSSANASIDRAALDAVKGFHAALSAGNSAAVQRALAPGVIIMEGGNVERSRDEYASHHLTSDLKFLRAMKYTLQRQSGDSVGALAWIASEATLTGESQGKPVELVSTESLVLKKTQDGWKIVHIHWSSRNRNKA